MALRRMRLPPGWYPRDGEEARELLRSLERKGPLAEARVAIAGISPHAGWHYCVSFAVRTFERLDRDADCLVLFGGHLPAGASPRLALEDAFETPFGDAEADAELRDGLSEEIECLPDVSADNTVEVLLPLARHFFPKARLISLRVPNDESSIAIGKKAALLASGLGRTAVAVGSTDLTHYGEAYGFVPKGRGSTALSWVREENDARIVAAMKAMNAAETLRLGETESSACSSGAAAAAIAFASSLTAERGELNGYGTSADAEIPLSRPPEQFVGYASISYLS